MAYGLPARDEHDWDVKLNASIAALKSEQDGRLSDATLSATYAQIFPPEKYGAVGDGTTDDTTALQAAFTAASNAPGKGTVLCQKIYKTTAPLFFWGDVDVVGAGTIILDTATSLEFWINSGISAQAVSADPWKGVWSVNITATSAVTHCGRLFQIHRCDGVTLSNFTIDHSAAGDVPASATGSGNNNAWCTTPSKTGITVSRVKVVANQSAANLGGEGISVSAATKVVVTDCVVSGVGDDALAMHGVTDFRLERNILGTKDGRIYIADSKGGKIARNTLKREAGAGGTYTSGGSLCYLGMENPDSYGSTACADILIEGNDFHHAPTQTSQTYGIRLIGVRRVMVANNTIHSRSHYGAGVHWEGKTRSGWTDPEGLDTDDKTRIRDLTVVNNVVVGQPSDTLAGGDTEAHGTVAENVIFAGQISGQITVARNAAGLGGTYLRSIGAYPDRPVLVKHSKPSTGAAYATLTASSFETVPISGYPTLDITGGAWDNAANTWRVPETGTYDIAAQVRMTDAAASRNVMLRIATSNTDGPDAVWRNQGGNRDVMTVRRVDRFTAGDLLRVVVYSDGASYPLMASALTILRVP